MKHPRDKHRFTRRYDRLVKGLLALVAGLAVQACSEPDEPTPEYGVQPMYGVPTTLIEPSKTPLP